MPKHDDDGTLNHNNMYLLCSQHTNAEMIWNRKKSMLFWPIYNSENWNVMHSNDNTFFTWSLKIIDCKEYWLWKRLTCSLQDNWKGNSKHIPVWKSKKREVFCTHSMENASQLKICEQKVNHKILIYIFSVWQYTYVTITSIIWGLKLL